MEFRSTPLVTRRRVKCGLWLLALGVVAWLLISLTVAHQLTRRRRPPFAEPAPEVAWGGGGGGVSSSRPDSRRGTDKSSGPGMRRGSRRPLRSCSCTATEAVGETA